MGKRGASKGGRGSSSGGKSNNNNKKKQARKRSPQKASSPPSPAEKPKAPKQAAEETCKTSSSSEAGAQGTSPTIAKTTPPKDSSNDKPAVESTRNFKENYCLSETSDDEDEASPPLPPKKKKAKLVDAATQTMITLLHEEGTEEAFHQALAILHTTSVGQEGLNNKNTVGERKKRGVPNRKPRCRTCGHHYTMEEWKKYHVIPPLPTEKDKPSHHRHLLNQKGREPWRFCKVPTEKRLEGFPVPEGQRMPQVRTNQESKEDDKDESHVVSV